MVALPQDPGNNDGQEGENGVPSPTANPTAENPDGENPNGEIPNGENREGENQPPENTDVPTNGPGENVTDVPVAPTPPAPPPEGTVGSPTDSLATDVLTTTEQSLTPSPPILEPSSSLISSSSSETSTGPSQPPGGSSNSGQLGPPAVAGIAIGCVLSGLLIGLIVAWLVLRRRHRSQARGGNTLERQGTRHQPIPVTSVVEHKGYPTSNDSTDGSIQLSHFILDATPDKDMASELGSLGQLIQSHVENHYHSHHIQTDQQALVRAAANLGVGQSSGLGADMLASLALDPRKRQLALQRALSYVLFTSIDFSARKRLSMLPAPVAAFLLSIPPAERGQANQEAVSLGLNKWRTMSSFLLHPVRSDRTTLPPSEPAMRQQAAALAAALNTFLLPFVPQDSASHARQKSHLEDVIVEVAKFGYVLLSQPCDYRFVHQAGGTADARVVVICAGLEKVTARDGTPLSSPQQVLAPVMVQF